MTLTDELQVAARAGDWERLEALAARLPSGEPPATEAELADYLFHLQAALIAAKIARADVVKSLHRLTAASGFHQFT